MITVDVHTHFIPRELIGHGGRLADVEMSHPQGYRYPLHRSSYDQPSRLASMENRQIDHAIVSVAPTFFMYWETGGASFSKEVNDSLAEYIAGSGPWRTAVATLPMRERDAATAERLVRWARHTTAGRPAWAAATLVLARGEAARDKHDDAGAFAHQVLDTISPTALRETSRGRLRDLNADPRDRWASYRTLVDQLWAGDPPEIAEQATRMAAGGLDRDVIFDKLIKDTSIRA